MAGVLDGPATRHSRNKLCEATQNILDRVLFTAFAEDRDLLPRDIVARASDQRPNPFDPQPMWNNVGILGHVFEQSISDLEEMQDTIAGQVKARKRNNRREAGNERGEAADDWTDRRTTAARTRRANKQFDRFRFWWRAWLLGEFRLRRWFVPYSDACPGDPRGRRKGGPALNRFRLARRMPIFRASVELPFLSTSSPRAP